MRYTDFAHRRLLACVGIILAGLAVRGRAQELPDVPDLRDVQGLPYASLAQDDFSSPQLSHADLQSAVQLFNNYLRGVLLLSNYEEPMLTRGSQGIAVFNAAAPAVVVVVAASVDGDQVALDGIGTGVVVDSTGLVITNWHVIQGADAAVVFVKPSGGIDLEDAYEATVVAQDPQADLALLRIGDPPGNLVALPVVNESPQVGQDIHVIGHPSELWWSYTTGVVSQIRENYPWVYADGSQHRSTIVQIQTAINPGNSGGPVLDDQAQIVGLVAWTDEGQQNLNFAIAPGVISAFLSQAQAISSGGVTLPEGDAARAEYSAATYDGDRKIIKAAYPDLTLYAILDPEGRHVGVVAEVPESNTFVKAWQPAPTGGFFSWSLNREDGEVLAMGAGNGGTPTVFYAP